MDSYWYYEINLNLQFPTYEAADSFIHILVS